MKVSMNGFRKQLSCDIERLREMVKSIILDQYDERFDKEELVDLTNELICKSNSLNCIYSPGDPDFKEMGDIEIPLIEL